MTQEDVSDRAMMLRCIELSRAAIREGEYPFATVIALDGRILAEAINRTRRDRDVTRHAEIIALSGAQKAASRDELRRATLYTNVEPCAMCSYCIREAWIGRVVYSLSSPAMGGVSKWNILRDEDISSRIPIFGPVPEVVSGLLLREVEQAWRAWNPLAWEMVKLHGVLSAQHAEKEPARVFPARARSPLQQILALIARLNIPRPKRMEEAVNPPDAKLLQRAQSLDRNITQRN
ncbi:MAG: nucleoside deaminase [Rhodomicrobium sp.]|nr:nucleoside deaminase [Rhodomicrobium sp.]